MKIKKQTSTTINNRMGKSKATALATVALVAITGLTSSFMAYASFQHGEGQYHQPIAHQSKALQQADQPVSLMLNFLKNLQYLLATQPAPSLYLISQPGHYLPNLVSAGYYNSPQEHVFNKSTEKTLEATQVCPYNNAWQAYQIPMQNLRLQFLNNSSQALEMKNTESLMDFIDNLFYTTNPQKQSFKSLLHYVTEHNNWQKWVTIKNGLDMSNKIPTFEYSFFNNQSYYEYTFNYYPHNIHPIHAQLWIYFPSVKLYVKMPQTIGEFIDLIIKYYMPEGIDIAQQMGNQIIKEQQLQKRENARTMIQANIKGALTRVEAERQGQAHAQAQAHAASVEQLKKDYTKMEESFEKVGKLLAEGQNIQKKSIKNTDIEPNFKSPSYFDSSQEEE